MDDTRISAAENRQRSLLSAREASIIKNLFHLFGWRRYIPRCQEHSACGDERDENYNERESKTVHMSVIGDATAPVPSLLLRWVRCLGCYGVMSLYRIAALWQFCGSI